MRSHYGYTSPSIGGLFRGSTVTKLIIANIAVYIVQLLLGKTAVMDYFVLYPRLVLTRLYLWQLVTYMFLHGGLLHLAFNMFIVWMFGSALESFWGGSRFLKYYLLCGLGGALFSFIFAFKSGVIGASAAGFGILLAYGLLFPYSDVYIFGLIPVRARTLVIALAVLELIRGLSGGTGIAHFAHLGGMAAGFIYLRSDYRMRRLWGGVGGLLGRAAGRISLKKNGRRRGGDGDETAERIDSILDKISSKGYENLSETEKRILENYSRRSTRH